MEIPSKPICLSFVGRFDETTVSNNIEQLSNPQLFGENCFQSKVYLMETARKFHHANSKQNHYSM